MVEENLVLDKKSLAHWEQLRNRLADELSRGFTVARLATETGLMAAQVEAWAADPSRFREPRNFGESSLAQHIEASLVKRFSDLDAERDSRRSPGTVRIETSVMLRAMHAFSLARKTPAMVDFTAPPGIGKSQAVDEYLANCRKFEGFGAPVWKIELSEFTLSAKGVLTLIAEQIKRAPNVGSEFELARHIETATEGRGGVLIVDEAQHLADALNINSGLRIINGLRRFVDKGLFGIVFVNNGEIYRRLQDGKHAQLFSRMEAWRVEVSSVTEDDVDKIMAVWRVSGKAEREYSLKIASSRGTLRSLTHLYRRTLEEFGSIDVDLMRSVREGA